MRNNPIIQSHSHVSQKSKKKNMMHSFSERMMMIIWSSCLVFSLFNLMFVSASPARHLCRPDQRDALWEFQSEFYVQEFDSNEKWRNNTDCCSWDGVTCDPKMGEVVELDLMDRILNGPLRSNSSLFRLQHLQSLNLGSNNLSGILPDSLDNLKYLSVLSLSGCSFFGKIPSSLGNLSYLTTLDLDGNHFTGELPDSIGNLKWLTKLRLYSSKLSGNFPPMLLNLSELTNISLGCNQFKGMLPSNMSSLSKLVYFDISGNSFYGSIPSSFFMIPSLIYLDLGRNGFSGSLKIGNISSPSKLQYLSLGDNNFSGSIPRFIAKLVGLSHLDLSYWNTGRGTVDFSIFSHLKSLEILHLWYMNTRSMVDLSLFSHLMSLRELGLSGNKLKFNSTLHLPSSISSLSLKSCNLSKFPKFLQAQTKLDHLDISANQIEGQVPEWLWRLPLLRHVNISQSSLSGFEGPPDVIRRSEKIVVLDISSNKFEGPFPLLPIHTIVILSSNNRFSGEIPRAICELNNLGSLDLSNNNFSGSIPQCFNTSLQVLNLQNNSLSGIFPEESIGLGLKYLDVGHNRFSGDLPKSLFICTGLEFLNIEENRFNDTFPISLRLFPNLRVLVLRSNELHGPIPSSGDSLSFRRLQIFDISKNRFTGVLPSDYFVGWSAMSSGLDMIADTPFGFIDSVDVTMKGSKIELAGSVFSMYKTIDVSGNKFKGDIPESISLLKGLIVLNMSNNAFTGHILPSMSNLTNLQSLDLSENRLSGEIPSELGKLTFLALMNFSYNMLEGPIPQGTQIQTQSNSSFAENLGLCGAPLQKTCSEGEEEARKQEQEQDEEKEDKEVLNRIAAVLGYIFGILCGLTMGHVISSYKHD